MLNQRQTNILLAIVVIILFLVIVFIGKTYASEINTKKVPGTNGYEYDICDANNDGIKEFFLFIFQDDCYMAMNLDQNERTSVVVGMLIDVVEEDIFLPVSGFIDGVPFGTIGKTGDDIISIDDYKIFVNLIGSTEVTFSIMANKYKSYTYTFDMTDLPVIYRIPEVVEFIESLPNHEEE